MDDARRLPATIKVILYLALFGENKHDFLEIDRLFLQQSYLFSPKNSSKYN